MLTAVGIFNSFVSDPSMLYSISVLGEYNIHYVLLHFFFQLSKCHHYCCDATKSPQMPLMTSGTSASNPVNSFVKKECSSFGLEAISFRSSRGAQATPTEKMVIPTTEIFLSELKPSSSLHTHIFHTLVHSCRENCLVMSELNPCTKLLGRFQQLLWWEWLNSLVKTRSFATSVIYHININHITDKKYLIQFHTPFMIVS